MTNRTACFASLVSTAVLIACMTGCSSSADASAPASASNVDQLDVCSLLSQDAVQANFDVPITQVFSLNLTTRSCTWSANNGYVTIASVDFYDRQDIFENALPSKRVGGLSGDAFAGPEIHSHSIYVRYNGYMFSVYTTAVKGGPGAVGPEVSALHADDAAAAEYEGAFRIAKLIESKL